jgi:competence protein ComEA
MHDRKKLRWWIAGGVVVALVLGYALPQHRANHAFTLNPPEATVPAQLLASDQNSSAASKTPAPPPMRIVVYVCGDVRRPGVYTFAASARVADGIARAGGALPDADLEQLNLAEPLSDAMKVDVPKRGQIVPAASYDNVVSASTTHGSRRHSSRHGGVSRHKLQPGQTLNINTAAESELITLPGVGPGLARRIVEYRTANGPFQTVDDLQNVSGIGPSKFERMAPYIRL